MLIRGINEELKMTKKITWKVEKRKLSEITPHKDNPRTFTEKGMKDLEKSFKAIGFAQAKNEEGRTFSEVKNG